MGLFRMSYDKPGKGVDENAPQKRGLFRFWEVFGRKSGKLFKVNLLYSLALIPTFLLVLFLTGMITSPILSMDSVRGIIRSIAEQNAGTTGISAADLEVQLCVSLDVIGRLILTYLFTVLWGMGPATAGATFVWRNFAREDHAWIWSDFKDAAKGNFKQSLVVFVIDLIVFALFCIAIRVYSSMPGILGFFQFVIWGLVLLYTLMHFYLYPMMVTFRLSTKDLYRNAVIFAIGKLPSNLLTLVLLLLIHLGPVYLVIHFESGYFPLFLALLWVLEATIFLSFSGFLVNFSVYPKMKKYMMPEEEKSSLE